VLLLRSIVWLFCCGRGRWGKGRDCADEIQCFKQGQKEELYVGYALSPSFG
jgi:hypothetical protein